MTDVFISYSVKDEELAKFVHSHLIAKGLSVFLASISLAPGERWTQKIIDEMRSSEWVCLLASKSALASPNVQLEVGGAIFSKKKLVSLMWDIQPAELPRWISDFQGIILTEKSRDDINQEIEKLAIDIKQKKVNGQLLVAAVIAGLWLFSK